MTNCICIVILLACITFSFAQSNNIEALIRQLDQKNARIVAKGDTLALMKLLAPEFTINRSTGEVVSGRDKTLQLMRGGMVSYDSFTVNTEIVLVKNSKLAISMGNEVVVLGGNRPEKGEIVRRRFTHVWIKENGEWKLLARHANNICTDNSKINVANSYDSVLLDKDGNRYQLKFCSDNTLWMTSNLNLNIAGSYCYEKKENCDRYGRLYTWDAANKGCHLLGNGWRLPGNDEWAALVMHYGGIHNDSIDIRKQAYKELLDGGTSQFNALLGGGRDPGGEYARLEAHGFYWTATENDSGSAWYYNFAKGSASLYQQFGGEKTRAFSVRCVK